MNDPMLEVPEPARSELLAISVMLMQLARQLLESNGSVSPCGVELRADGSSSLLAAGEEMENAAATRDLLRQMLRRRGSEGAVRAAALAFDSLTLQPEADVALTAVCVNLEHVDGHAVDVFIPFKKGWFGYSYRNPFMLEAPCRIFEPATPRSE